MDKERRRTKIIFGSKRKRINKKSKRANELLFKWFSGKKYETKNKSKLFKYEKSGNDSC